MKVSFLGIGEQVATFEAVTSGATAVQVNAPAVMSGNGKISASSKAGELPAGMVTAVRGDFAAVQIGGYMKLPCDAALTVGYQHLVTDASGKLKSAAAGRPGLVVDVADGVCGVIL